MHLPPRIFGDLTLASSTSASGTIAFADRNCVWVRGLTTWRTYDARGRAATARASRRTRSAYDKLDRVGVDVRGRVSLLYRRVAS